VDRLELVVAHLAVTEGHRVVDGRAVRPHVRAQRLQKVVVRPGADRDGGDVGRAGRRTSSPGEIGVVAAGASSDKSGPIRATAWTFLARIGAFALIAIDQSAASVAIFALVFGATFLATGPLTVVFVRESFGMRHLGALSGLITMVHHICGGIGAYLGAALFDATTSYNAAFIAMLISAMIALILTLMLSRTATTMAQPAG